MRAWAMGRTTPRRLVAGPGGGRRRGGGGAPAVWRQTAAPVPSTKSRRRPRPGDAAAGAVAAGRRRISGGARPSGPGPAGAGGALVRLRRGHRPSSRSAAPAVAPTASRTTRPSRISIRRSAVRATSGSWVTTTTVWPSRWKRWKQLDDAALSSLCSSPVGSSARIRRGSLRQRAGDGHALALAAGELRRAGSPGGRPGRPSVSSAGRAGVALLDAARRPPPSAARRSRRRVSPGSRWKRWKTKPMACSRRRVRSASRQSASTSAGRPAASRAAVGRSSRPTICSRVLLPEPDGPTMATNSPSSMRRVTSSQRDDLGVADRRRVRQTWRQRRAPSRPPAGPRPGRRASPAGPGPGRRRSAQRQRQGEDDDERGRRRPSRCTRGRRRRATVALSSTPRTQAEADADQAGDQADQHRLGADGQQDRAAGDADRPQGGELQAPLGHRAAEHVADEQRADRQRQPDRRSSGWRHGAGVDLLGLAAPARPGSKALQRRRAPRSRSLRQRRARSSVDDDGVDDVADARPLPEGAVVHVGERVGVRSPTSRAACRCRRR